MENQENYLERNEDGSLKIFELEELPFFAKVQFAQLKRAKFIVGKYFRGNNTFGYVLPLAETTIKNMPADALESFARQQFEAHMLSV